MSSRKVAQDKLRRERLAREQAAAAAARRRRFLSYGGAAVAVAGVIAVLAVILAGGDDGGSGGQGSGSGAAPEPILDVHGVGVDPADGALYIATHSGVFRSPEGTDTAERVDAPEQDLMGFSVAGPGRFVASGHPGPGQQLPPSLGLIESRDGGRSWRSLSLQGEADFHVLRAAGRVAYGYDGRLMVTQDGGRSWDELAPPAEIIDLAPNKADPERVLASTAEGVRVSSDGGRSWRPGGLRVPVLLAWPKPKRAFAVDSGGSVYAARDPAGAWRNVGTVSTQPAAFAADARGELYVAGPDGAVDASSDRGKTWVPRSRN